MYRTIQIAKARFYFILLLILTGIISFVVPTRNVPAAHAQTGYDPSIQSAALLYNEARTVYLGNLARRDNGIPPLRWNLQLTHAARWFSWDSVENRSSGYCGHQDTLGGWPSDRVLTFGYLAGGGAENAYCGYLSPEDAIQGWMNSPGHRANLLDSNSREIGLGYYRRASDGRGYVTQDFGNDAVYAPVIIENEALSTASPNVNLYIYDRQPGAGFSGFSAATQMMVSNDPKFAGASWEPYNPNKSWTLASGSGWRSVYVKTRDKFNRSLTANDTIFLGDSAPLNGLGDAQMTSTQSKVTIYNLNSDSYPQVQFSAGWLADDSYGSFGKLWGNGEQVNDPSAWGETAYRLYPGAGESAAWVYDTTFIQNIPMVAYFRLKVNDNTSSSEVARISVQGGPTEYGPLSLRGTDFHARDQYQEFAINFTFKPTANDPFLIFNFWRDDTANVDLYVDGVSIFSAPQPITSPLTWSFPGGNYRGQGIWLRYTDGSQFSDPSDAITAPSIIAGNTGVGGTTLTYNDGIAKTVETDSAGNYSITVPFGWSGTVTPSHSCYNFSPASRSYNNVTADLAGQHYTSSFNNAPICAVTVGVFRPSNGLIYLKNSNTTGFADVAINYGMGGDYPIAGDWDGDGVDTIGVYRNGVFYLRNSNSVGIADVYFSFGAPGDQPIAGDWDGDGIDTIGVYRSSNFTFYLRNSNSAGASNAIFSLGIPGDIGISGDWDGDGKDTTGVFRPSNGVIFLKNTNETGYADIAINYGIKNDKPVTGDWNNDGIDTIGVLRGNTFYLRNSNSVGNADMWFAMGIPGDMPIAGNWDGRP